MRCFDWKKALRAAVMTVMLTVVLGGAGLFLFLMFTRSA